MTNRSRGFFVSGGRQRPAASPACWTLSPATDQEAAMPAKRVCTTKGCPELVDHGKCDDCKRKAEALRGSAWQRGYATSGHLTFRRLVLTRDPLCVCPDQDHGHQARACLSQSVVADHYPLSRRELVDARLNPNAPERGRGLCKRCHDKHTSTAQPGGWNQR